MALLIYGGIINWLKNVLVFQLIIFFLKFNQSLFYSIIIFPNGGTTIGRGRVVEIIEYY